LQYIGKNVTDVLAKLNHTAGCGGHVPQFIESTNELTPPDIDKLW
jgi:hypothetical protein